MGEKRLHDYISRKGGTERRLIYRQKKLQMRNGEKGGRFESSEKEDKKARTEFLLVARKITGATLDLRHNSKTGGGSGFRGKEKKKRGGSLLPTATGCKLPVG